MAILATLLGCQGTDEFHAMLPAALNFGVTPVEIKEIVYQAVAYLGIGRVFPFLKITNEVLKEKGHLGLSIPRSLTLCILSGCGSLYLFPSAAGGSFSDDG